MVFIKRLTPCIIIFVASAFIFGNPAFAQYRSADQIQAERLKMLAESSERTTTDGWLYKCNMYDDVTVYYVMPNDEILQTDANGKIRLVGFKDRPPLGREKEFSYMISIVTEPPVTYAVDRYGHVWQRKYPYQEIVGQTVDNTSK
ncbi:hypothetical protein C7N43_35465 [Sphingobacteriales bacterium UPWRP_1]|nr:hypothetical protein BVG80_03805 [Sphingobacteriales bacterium TSM_CSM]PSJ72202.1 hypothetical protein C7N43_35465 [Sphingobacteriales bacterium UPWRP_1]